MIVLTVARLARTTTRILTNTLVCHIAGHYWRWTFDPRTGVHRPVCSRCHRDTGRHA